MNLGEAMSILTPGTVTRRADLVTTVRVERYAEGDVEVVCVPLFGVRGAGFKMVLEAEVWDAGLAAGWPCRWYAATPDKSQRRYAVTNAMPLSPDGEYVWLGRIVAGAKKGQVVKYIDGNTLNLKRSNLAVMTRTQAARKCFAGAGDATARKVIVEDVRVPSPV